MARRSLRHDDRANLMLLAGVVVTIGFIATALTLAQVSHLERQAASATSSSIPSEWRFLRERVAFSLNVSINGQTSNETLADTIVPSVGATYRVIESEKGYDMTLRLAGSSGVFNKTEAGFVNAGNYDGSYAINGPNPFNWAYDGVNDGRIWKTPCDDPTVAPLGCIAGVVLHMSLTDGQSTIDETLLFSVNQG